MKHVLSVLADNNSGVLLRVCGLFSRRGYSISSINAAQTEDPHISRMTIVVDCDNDTLQQIEQQLLKLVDIREVIDLLPDKRVCRDHIMVRVGNSENSISSLIQIANLFMAKIIDVSSDSLILELTGRVTEIDNFVRLLKPYGIRKLVRTGISALERW